MYIKSIYLKNFKSFREQTFEFLPGLTTIAGPNGSGKSNVFDAIVFVLGNTSGKKLRYKNLRDLIHNGLDSDFAQVKLTFSDGTEIERFLSENTSVFRLNGKRTTKESINSFLEEKNIKSDGHNIVFQEDVKKIIEITDLERKKVIEDIANISKFNEQRDKAIKNLEKVQEKIKQTEMILKEREEWLKKLEVEKKDAEEYLKILNEKRYVEGALLKKEKKQLEKEISTYETKIKNIEIFLLDKSKQLADIIKDKNILQIELENAKTNLDNLITQNKDLFSNFNLKKYQLTQLENDISIAEKKANSYVINLNQLENNSNDFNKQIKDIEKEISQKEEELHKLKKIGLSENELKNVKEKAIIFENETSKLETKKLDLETKINSLKFKMQEINLKQKYNLEKQNKLNELKTKLKTIKLIDLKEIKNNFANAISQKEDSLKKITKLENELRDVENNIIQKEQEIKTLKTIKFKLISPIEISSEEEITKYVKEKEGAKEYGTYVFIFKNIDAKLKKQILIKNVTPENKIKKLYELIEDLKETKIFLNENLSVLKEELSKLNINLEKLNKKIRNKEYENNQTNREKQNLEMEINKLEKELNNNVIEKIDLNEINSLEMKLKEINLKLNNQKDNTLFSKLSDALTKQKEISQKDRELQNLKFKLKNIKNEQKIGLEKHKELKKNHLEMIKIIKEFKEKYEKQKTEFKVLKTKKENIEISIYKNEKQLKDLELKARDLENKKNQFNDEIVKKESDKEHNNDLLKLKIAQHKEKEKEILEFIKEHNTDSLDMEKMAEFEKKDLNFLRERLFSAKAKMAETQNINLKAIDDYKEFKEKYDEINLKLVVLREEKQEVENDLNQIILEKDKKFMYYFNKIKTNFASIGKELGLGNADLKLTDENLDKAGVKFVFKRGKKEKNIFGLSGGEKSLTTIAFILSIVNFEPAPFYLFDEIDAALDYSNTLKIANYLKNESKNKQIIIISHNPETISRADALIGISKNRLGITVVAVRKS